MTVYIPRRRLLIYAGLIWIAATFGVTGLLSLVDQFPVQGTTLPTRELATSGIAASMISMCLMSLILMLIFPLKLVRKLWPWYVGVPLGVTLLYSLITLIAGLP